LKGEGVSFAVNNAYWNGKRLINAEIKTRIGKAEEPLKKEDMSNLRELN
jgi:hypothetical protein